MRAFQLCYTSTKVSIQKKKKKVWQTIRNQDSVVILFCCVLAYIRPVLSFDCLLSLFSLLEGYWMYNRMWISFFFHLLCPCYSVLLSEKVRNVSGTSQVHCEHCKLGHLIYLMNFNTVAILTSIILVSVDIVAVLCIIKTRANSVTLDYFCYCYKIWQCDYGHSSVQSGHFQFSNLIIPSTDFFLEFRLTFMH